MKNIYLTTTLPYVNSKPHLGFALEIIHADIIARYERLMGNAVFFNTGTDEHGQKIYEKASEEGRDTQAYVDEFAAKFKSLKDSLNLSFDRFIRTTDPDHKAAAQEMWRRCLKNGDIYKKKYRGLYCVGDEMFLKDSDLVNGRCPNHPNMVPQEIEEENYFFKLSKYQERLLKYLENDVITPSWRKTEAMNFVKSGLEDFSISREKGRLIWGVPVPDDENQVMYVWFDALTNYISTLGWPKDPEKNFSNFWEKGTVIQTAGKDQVRFQSIIWQAMLMSAGIKNTDRVVYHGFVTSQGQKMSKSLGNVVDPLEIVDKYGTDVLRYWCAKEANTFEDSDFTWEKFRDSYNADLANGLGNLVSRIMKMAVTNSVRFNPDIDFPKGIMSLKENDKMFAEYKKALEKFDIQAAAKAVWLAIGWTDAHIQSTEPFKKIKVNPSEAKEDILKLLGELYEIGLMLEPLLPETSGKIKSLVRDNRIPDSPIFPRWTPEKEKLDKITG